MLSHPTIRLILALTLLLASYRASAADLSDPKLAAREVLDALAAHDQPRLLAVMHVPSPELLPLADAMARMLVAGRQLGDAATERFGPAGAKAIADGAITAADAEMIDSARVEIVENTAEVYLPGQTLPMRFVRVDGQWRMSIDHFHGGQADQIDRQAGLLRLMAAAMEEATEEIAEDRHADAAAAEAAIRQKLNFVLMRSLTADPSTQTAGRPTTAPAP